MRVTAAEFTELQKQRAKWDPTIKIPESHTIEVEPKVITQFLDGKLESSEVIELTVEHRERKKQAKNRPDHESKFAADLKNSGITGFKREYKFHPTRKWPFDFAWPDVKLALEIEGGTGYQRKKNESLGHLSPKRFEENAEKYTEALLLGWRVIRVPPKWIYNNQALFYVERALKIDMDKKSKAYVESR